MTSIGNWIAASAFLLGAAGTESDPLMGIWQGECSHADGSVLRIDSKIAALGKGEYDLAVSVWIGDESHEFRMKGRAEASGSQWVIRGVLDVGEQLGGKLDCQLTFSDGSCRGTCKMPGGDARISMSRVKRRSPTLGASPPEGAIVLFDGSAESLSRNWVGRNGKPAPWKVENGWMEVRETDILTVEKLVNAEIHVEFMTPLMAEARGQGRGNSGVYVQGLYEVQVLDSFGQPPRDNEAGGIYQLAIPRVNASLPPGEWQTYDITFRGGKFDSDGKVVEPPVITVIYNGELIHDKVRLPRTTKGGVSDNPLKYGGLLLQNHGNPVRYRNIWMKPLP